MLADATNHYASWLIPYVTPSINNPEKKGNIHDLVMEISKDVLNSGRNITGDWLFSFIETIEELYKKKSTYVGTILPDRKGLLRNTKNSERRSSIISEIYVEKK